MPYTIAKFKIEATLSLSIELLNEFLEKSATLNVYIITLSESSNTINCYPLIQALYNYINIFTIHPLIQNPLI